MKNIFEMLCTVSTVSKTAEIFVWSWAGDAFGGEEIHVTLGAPKVLQGLPKRETDLKEKGAPFVFRNMSR